MPQDGRSQLTRAKICSERELEARQESGAGPVGHTAFQCRKGGLSWPAGSGGQSFYSSLRSRREVLLHARTADLLLQAHYGGRHPRARGPPPVSSCILRQARGVGEATESSCCSPALSILTKTFPWTREAGLGEAGPQS